MAIHFRDAALAPLDQLTVSAPDGAVIGIIGEDGNGQHPLMQLAGGALEPHSGSVERTGDARYIGPWDTLSFENNIAALAIDHALSLSDAVVRVQAAMQIDKLRRQGATVLIRSHDLDLLLSMADELWWIHGGRLQAKGDPREVAARYQQHVAARLRAWGESAQVTLNPSLRRGDGRAEILGIETAGANHAPTVVVQSGEPMSVRVTVRFAQAVDNPVVGIMIRTRIGSEVFGTNTELEKIDIGRVEPGQTIRVVFSFECRLCAQEYTITAASHDPNGVWHDWMEDALAFAVADTRYTAGVANLRASVVVERV